MENTNTNTNESRLVEISVFANKADRLDKSKKAIKITLSNDLDALTRAELVDYALKSVIIEIQSYIRRKPKGLADIDAEKLMTEKAKKLADKSLLHALKAIKAESANRTPFTRTIETKSLETLVLEWVQRMEIDDERKQRFGLALIMGDDSEKLEVVIAYKEEQAELAQAEQEQEELEENNAE